MSRRRPERRFEGGLASSNRDAGDRFARRVTNRRARRVRPRLWLSGHAQYELEGRALLATVTWTGAGGNLLWSTPGNWDTNQVPGTEDDAVIPDLPGTVTISIDALVDIRSVTSEEGLEILSEKSLEVSAGDSTVAGAFTVAGSLIATGAGTTFTALDTIAIDGGWIRAFDGGQIHLEGVAAATNPWIEARDPDSLVRLPDLASIDSDYDAPGIAAILRAENGGAVELPVLTVIAQATAGPSEDDADLIVYGAGSRLELPLLADLSGVDRIWLDDAAMLTLPAVTTWATPAESSELNYRYVSSSNGSTLELPNLTEIQVDVEDIYFQADLGGVIDLPSLESVVFLELDGYSFAEFAVFDPESAILLPSLTMADFVGFYTYDGATLEVPLLESIVGGSIFGWGVGASFSFPLLTEMSGVFVGALDGASVELPTLTTAVAVQFYADFGGEIRVDGLTEGKNLWIQAAEDSFVGFAGLTTLILGEDEFGSFPLRLEAYSGGQIDMPALTSVILAADEEIYAWGSIYLSGATSSLNVPLLEDLSALGRIEAWSEAMLEFPAVTTWISPADYQGWWSEVLVQANDDGIIEFPALVSLEIDMLGFRFAAGQGGVISMPLLETVTFGENPYRASFSADGEGSEIEVPLLTTGEDTHFLVAGGGIIDLPLVTSLNRSTVDISGATSTFGMPLVESAVSATIYARMGAVVTANAGTDIDFSSLNAYSGGAIVVPGVVTATNLRMVAYDADSLIDLPDLESLVNDYAAPSLYCDLQIDQGGTMNLPKLTEIVNGVAEMSYSLTNVWIRGAASLLNVPELANISGLQSLYVVDAATLSLPLIESYDTTDVKLWTGATRVFSVSGQSASLDLPNLTTIVAVGTGIQFQALSGGTILLESLVSAIEDESQIQFSADGTDSEILVPELTTGENLHFRVNAGGTIDLPLVTSLDGATVDITGATSTFGIPQVVSAVESAIYASNEASITLPAGTLVDYAIFGAYGGVIEVPGVIAATNVVIYSYYDNGAVVFPDLEVLISDYAAPKTQSGLFLYAGGLVSFPSLTTLLNGASETSYALATIWIQRTGSVLDVPVLDDISGLQSVYVTDGAELSLPLITHLKLEDPLLWSGATRVFSVQGENSVLELPNLEWIEAAGTALSFSAYEKGRLALPVLRAVNAVASAVYFDAWASGAGQAEIEFASDGTRFEGSQAWVSAGVGGLLTGDLELVSGAKLSGNGVVQGNVTNGGFVYPGTFGGPGILTIEGDYVQTVDGSLWVEINGLDVGTNYDRLIVTGSAQLAGRLNVARGFDALVGNSFVVLEYADRTGNFGLVTYQNGPVFDGKMMVSTTGATSTTVTVVQAPVVNVADAVSDEGDIASPQYQMAFVVSGVAPAGGATIQYMTTGGDPGVDYASTSGENVVPAGAYSFTVYVPIIGNQLLQNNRSFQLQAGAVGFDPVTGTGSIRDDDAPVSIAVASQSAATSVGTTFDPALTAVVKNVNGNVVQGATVVFNVAAAEDGATAFFAGGLVTSWAVSDSSGAVTVPALTANLVVGGPYSLAFSALDQQGVVVSADAMELVNETIDVELLGFLVQVGSPGRSFVRYVDMTFNTAWSLPEIVASIGTPAPRIKLTNKGLDGTGNTPYDLASKAAAVDKVIALDFGAQGIGGSRNLATGDGLYLLELDLDGNGSFETTRTFWRLLGDVDGNGEVNAADAQIVAWNIGTTGWNMAADANGDGIVNATDTLIVRRQKGRKIQVP